MNARPDASGDAAIREVASRWIVRLDRTLTPEENRELEIWLSSDPRHPAALERATRMWRTTRAIGAAVRQMPESEATVGSRGGSWIPVALLAAAAIVLGVFLLPRAQTRIEEPRAASVAQAAGPASRTRTLDDGTIVSLRGEAEIDVRFSETERRVRLLRGESYFAVTPNPDRPFVVDVGGTQVRVVGTSFAIRFAPDAVDVLVTEGTVQVNPSKLTAVVAPNSPHVADAAVVTAGHRAIVRSNGDAARVTVATASRAEINRDLAWNEPMLELAGATLDELAARFSRAAGRTIEIESALAGVRLGGQMPATDVEGFVRALEAIYQVKAERRTDGSIFLRSAQ